MARTPRAPWKRPNPRKRAGKKSRHLDACAKIGSEGAGSFGRASVPQSCGQHAHGIEGFKKEGRQEASGKEDRTQARRRKDREQETCLQEILQEIAKGSPKKSSKKSARKRPAKAPEKDPRGGLTAAGRVAFARKDGSHLKPGVTKKLSEMTPQDMRRKGSWAVRFYGRKKLPPLVDGRGRPTRHALSAHAWGEPVPRTVAAARRIAAKGERLLQRYQRIKRKS